MVFGDVGDNGFYCSWVVLLVGLALGFRKKGTVRGMCAGLADQRSGEGVGVNVGRRCGCRGRQGRRPVRLAMGGL